MSDSDRASVDVSSDEEEEEHFEDGFLEAVTKTGVVERRKDNEKKQKFYFYLLTGGTLFEYRTVKVKKLKHLTFHQSHKPASHKHAKKSKI